MNDWIFLLLTKKGAEQLDQANIFCIDHTGIEMKWIEVKF